MNEVSTPVTWVSASLDNVVDKIVGGGTPSKSNSSYYTGKIPWMSVKDMKKSILLDTVDHITQEAVDNSSTNIIPAGVPIVATRMSLGKIVIGKFDSAINQDLKAVFINEHVDSDYFVYWYRSLGQLIESLGTGTTVKGIRLEVLKELRFLLPSLAEQKQIAIKLDELLAQVDTIKTRLDAIPTILKRFRKSVLSAAVSGKLTEEWRANIEMHVLEGISLPVSWNLKRASEACLKVQSGSTPKSKPFEQGGTVPFLKVYNIVDQQINFNYKPQFVTKEVHMKSLKRSVAIPNDVLMNIVGPPLGKVALLTDQFPEWNLNQAITFFRSDPDQLLYKYMYYVLCEGALVRKVMPETKGSVGQINISLTQCRDFFIALPSLEEQKEIVCQVEKLFSYADQIEKQVKSAQARVNNLTQSILAKAFRGELTAEWREQNPDLISGENSAEALLKKIKEEREKLTQTKAKKKSAKKKAVA